MKLLSLKILLLFLAACPFLPLSANVSLLTTKFGNNYEAVVLGKITNKKIKKIGGFYITEYKLKTKKWLFKKTNIKEAEFLTIKILGADLREKGIVIKASTSPDYIPMNKEAVFLLENTKKKQKNVFTLQKNGIIYVENKS